MFLSDRMPKVISKLASLRTLRAEVDLSIEDDEFMRLEDLINMTQLQELWLRVNHHMEMRKIGRILAQLVNMRRLLIRNDTGIEFPRFPKKIRAMKLLESLALTSFAVPRWICDLANLRELELTGCDCSNYPELQRMPNLVRLELYENKKCIELPKAFGKSGGFPSLRFLTINYFSILEELPELEEGAMVFLEEFRLWNCMKVKKVGEGSERLKRLKEFKYYGSGTNEVRELLKEGGEYWNKIIGNNPHVTIQ
ncbi:hypothetical protein SUGI_0232370 [Cryptomeria japonica]|nr:hypothetical protein SUGI_0232370 [Cryptomeria japonica]